MTDKADTDGARSERKLLKAIDEIYVASLDPGRWEHAAEAVREAVGGHSVNLAVSDIRQTQISKLICTGFSEDDKIRYDRDILPHDDVLALLEGFDHTGSGIINGEVPPADIRRYWAYQEFYKRIGYFRFAVAVLKSTPTHRSWMSIARSESDAPYTKADERRLAALKPHLSRALEINRALASSAVPAALNQYLLEQIRVPVVLIDNEARVLERNEAAQSLEAERTHGIVGGRLRLADKTARAKVHAILNRTIPGIPGLVEAHINGQPRPILFCPVQLTRSDPWVTPGDSIWMVVFLDGTSGYKIPEPLLRIAFDLSPTEAEVASHLMDGLLTGDMAKAMQLTANGLRFHLKNIYRKTGTHTQGQLVAKLAATFPVNAIPSRDDSGWIVQDTPHPSS